MIPELSCFDRQGRGPALRFARIFSIRVMSAPIKNDLIIVLDDDRQLLPMTGRVLTRQGLRVETAASAAQLLEFDPELKSQAGVMLCDASILDLDRAIEHIREAAPDVKIVYISGHQLEHLAALGMQIEPQRFVAKPWRGKALASMVKALLEEG